MSSLSPKDRVSLCSFTFSDGRRCRTPRHRNNPRFCFYHAQKEARARTAQKLCKDLAYFFSGDYLSACDLSTALARLIPAVVRGDVKPRTARTVAYLAQTLLQTIHISEQEYINAFDTDDWRKAIRNSVNSNHDYIFPPDPEREQPESPQPQPQPAQTSVNCHSSLATHHSPLSHVPQPAPSLHTSLPPTSAEFVEQVVARLQAGGGQAPQPAETPVNCHSVRSADFALRENLLNEESAALQPAEIAVNCYSERSEESAFSELQADLSQIIPAPQQTHSPISAQAPPTLAPAPSPISAHAPQTPTAPTAPSYTACHPRRGEGSCLHHAASTTDETHPIPTTQFARPEAPAAQPDNPPRIAPSTPQRAPNRDAYGLHFDHNCRLLIDGKPF